MNHNFFNIVSSPRHFIRPLSGCPCDRVQRHHGLTTGQKVLVVALAVLLAVPTFGIGSVLSLWVLSAALKARNFTKIEHTIDYDSDGDVMPGIIVGNPPRIKHNVIITNERPRSTRSHVMVTGDGRQVPGTDALLFSNPSRSTSTVTSGGNQLVGTGNQERRGRNQKSVRFDTRSRPDEQRVEVRRRNSVPSISITSSRSNSTANSRVSTPRPSSNVTSSMPSSRIGGNHTSVESRRF